LSEETLEAVLLLVQVSVAWNVFQLYEEVVRKREKEIEKLEKELDKNSKTFINAKYKVYIRIKRIFINIFI